MSHTCLTRVSHLSHTCLTPVSHLSHTCLTHVSHMSHTCLTPVSHLSHTCLTPVSHMSHICLTHVSHLSHTCLHQAQLKAEDDENSDPTDTSNMAISRKQRRQSQVNNNNNNSEYGVSKHPVTLHLSLSPCSGSSLLRTISLCHPLHTVNTYLPTPPPCHNPPPPSNPSFPRRTCTTSLRTRPTSGIRVWS